MAGAQSHCNWKNEKIYWILGYLGIAVTVAMIFIHYDDLPKKFPIHFNARGEPDRYGEPLDLFGLPIISFITLLFMQWIASRVVQINPHKMGVKNAAQVAVTKVMIAQLALYCVVLFGWITFQSMVIATGKVETLTSWTLIFAFFVPLLLLAIYLYRLNSIKETKVN